MNNLARHLAFAVKGLPLLDATDAQDTHARRAVLLATIWTVFVLEALLAGVAAPSYAAWSLALPVLILLALVVCNLTLEPERR